MTNGTYPKAAFVCLGMIAASIAHLPKFRRVAERLSRSSVPTVPGMAICHTKGRGAVSSSTGCGLAVSENWSVRGIGLPPRSRVDAVRQTICRWKPLDSNCRSRVVVAVISTAFNRSSADAPPFMTIARRSDEEFDRLPAFLMDHHPKMPNFNLSRQEISDLVAYIHSLKP